MKNSQQGAIHVSCGTIEVTFNRQNVPLVVNQVSLKRELFLPSVPLGLFVRHRPKCKRKEAEDWKIVGFVSLTDHATTIFVQCTG